MNSELINNFAVSKNKPKFSNVHNLVDDTNIVTSLVNASMEKEYDYIAYSVVSGDRSRHRQVIGKRNDVSLFVDASDRLVFDSLYNLNDNTNILSHDLEYVISRYELIDEPMNTDVTHIMTAIEPISGDTIRQFLVTRYCSDTRALNEEKMLRVSYIYLGTIYHTSNYSITHNMNTGVVLSPR